MADDVVQLSFLTCLHCGHRWLPRLPKRPKVCPNRQCKSLRWDKPPRWRWSKVRPKLPGVVESSEGPRLPNETLVAVHRRFLKGEKLGKLAQELGISALRLGEMLQASLPERKIE